MATLLSAVTTDTTGSGASHSGPCTVMVHGDSVFDGAQVLIEIANTDTAADYTPIGREGYFKQPGSFNCQGQGTYYLRAVLRDAGTNTSVTCVTTQ